MVNTNIDVKKVLRPRSKLSSTLTIINIKESHLAITWCIVCQGETTTTILMIRWSYPNMVFVNFIKHLPSMLEAPLSWQHYKIFPWVFSCIIVCYYTSFEFSWLFSLWFWNYVECYNSIILFFVLMYCAFFYTCTMLLCFVVFFFHHLMLAQIYLER